MTDNQIRAIFKRQQKALGYSYRDIAKAAGLPEHYRNRIREYIEGNRDFEAAQYGFIRVIARALKVQITLEEKS